jgi:hypothetical protein
MVFLLLSGSSLLIGWPTPWFGPVAGLLVAPGLLLGLSLSRRRPEIARGVARGLFLVLGVSLGALGLWSLTRPEQERTGFVAWVALACAAVYLIAAAHDTRRS